MKINVIASFKYIINHIETQDCGYCIDSSFRAAIVRFTWDGQETIRHPENTLYLLTSAISFAVDNALRVTWSDASVLYELFARLAGGKVLRKSVFDARLTSASKQTDPHKRFSARSSV